jgi:hypothetical protein
VSNDTFVVGIYFRHRIVSWPFGRLDVTRDEISVRSWPAGRRSAAVPRSDVMAISVNKGRAVSMLRIEDVGGIFAHVAVEMPFGLDRIVDKLKNNGYEITAAAR